MDGPAGCCHVIDNIDVVSITSDEKTAYINYIHVNKGSINQSFTFEYKKKLDESDADLLSLGIVEIRERFNSKAKEIIVPFNLELELDGITLTVPQRGEIHIAQRSDVDMVDNAAHLHTHHSMPQPIYRLLWQDTSF